jgi:hypothetical protein
LVGGGADPRLSALSWAILAPNPHNRQPWIAERVGNDEVRIFRDPARNLPKTDPFERQLTIGMGCFLELMTIAAAETRHGVDITLFPEGERGPVATARFRAGGALPDPLFRHAANRRSCKEPFTAEPVSAGQEAALSAHATILRQPDMVAKLKTLTWDAWLTEVRTPAAHKESVDLMRFGRREIEANPDGIDLGGPMLESLMLAGILTRESQLDPQSSGFRQGVEIYREMLAATPAYAVITSTGNTRADQIDAGRRWLRLNLATTGLGLALHPVSQALQEFPEMKPHYEAAHGLLAKPGETVQMLGRLGYGPEMAPTPRWPLQSRMRHG